MEKTTDFSVVKQKIIKTHELFSLYSEKTIEIENLQKLCQQLRNTLVLNKEEINKLKLKNESLSFSLQKTCRDYEPLNQEHAKLKTEYEKLEKEYHEAVNSWQIKYQTTNQELLELRSVEKPIKKKVCGSGKSAEIKLENEMLKEQSRDLERLVEELRAKLSKVQNVKDSGNKLELKEREIAALKIKLRDKDRDCVDLKLETDRLRRIVDDLTRKNKKLRSENGNLQSQVQSKKDDDMRDALIEDLTQQNVDLKKENKTLCDQIQSRNAVEEQRQESVKSPTDEEIDEIMKENFIPKPITPLYDIETGDEEEINEIASSSGNFSVSDYRNSGKIMKISPKFSRRRRNNVIKKKKLQKIDLFGALLALKKAKINFTISNDSLVEPQRVVFPVLTPRIEPKPPVIESNITNTSLPESLAHKLSCSLGCCTKNSSYLLLKEGPDDENCPLLGFFGVKNETPSRVSSRLDSNVENGVSVHKKEESRRSKSKRTINVNKINKRRRQSETDSGVGSDLAEKNPDCDLHQAENLEEKKETPIIAKKIVIEKRTPVSSKKSFKRPLCRTRQSPRLLASKMMSSTTATPEVTVPGPSPVDSDRPASPPSCEKFAEVARPKIIPLEKVEESEKMAASKIETLFEKLVNFSREEKVLNEVVEEFSGQDPEFVAHAILEKVSTDTHDSPDSKYPSAPVMTETQRVMLGFMSRLEKMTSSNTFDHFLTLAERRLLTTTNLEELQPITRLYLAVCKLQMNIHRIRRLCCDVFYFNGDLAVPVLFTVLTSWAEVIPQEALSQDVPLARVLVHLVFMKSNMPGYNLFPLKNLLKFYGYSVEKCNSEELFQELFQRYLRNPVRSSDYALLLFCKNHPEKWVNGKIEQFFKPLVEKATSENFKAAVIILIGNLSFSFTSKSEVNYLSGIKEWMKNLVTETTPDVVRRSVYLCLKRLRKK